MTQRYIVIQEWMLDLGLKGSELTTYALIYGFCQDGESDFHGSTSYVARWCGISRQQAVAVLRKLTEGGHLIKSGEPGYPAHYRISYAEGGVSFPYPSNDLTWDVKLFDRGCQETGHNSKEDNKEHNKDSCSSPRACEDMNEYGEYVRMSSANYARLVSRFGADDATRLCEILDSYLAKKPNVYRDHYRAILGWPVQRLQEEKLNQQRIKNAQEAGQRVASSGSAGMASGYGAQGLADMKRWNELINKK